MLNKIKRNPKLKWALIVMASLFTIFILFFASIYFGAWGELPSSTELKELKQNRATQVLANNGELIGKFYVDDRQPITYQEFPKHLIDALIATEDVRFFEHNGIDNRSLLRVFFKSILLQDDSAGGGSTISLQLAKNIYGRKDYGPFGIVVNKFQEVIIANRLEDVYSKEEILRLYFNTVPFSDNTYGIESASMKFFGKHTSEISLEEAAVLVGTLKASHSYNPRIFPERSRLRRDVVLEQMGKYGYLTEAEVKEAKQTAIVLNYKNYSHDKGLAPYFRAQIRKDLSKILDTLKNKDGKKFNIYRDGLSIHTTLNYKMQSLAEEALKEHLGDLQKQHEAAWGKSAPWLTNQQIVRDALKRTSAWKNLAKEGKSENEILEILNRKQSTELFDYDKVETKNISTKDSVAHYLKFLNAGMLAVTPQTGAVQAWVGGIDFKYFKYDHVSQSKRQVGSTFKPFVYTAALENGIEPCTYFSAREVSYANGWTPSNSGGDEDDPHINYNLKEALSKSMNTIAVKVLMETGIENVVNQAKAMGINSELPKVPSIALGTASLSLAELTEAYTPFVNEGKTSRAFYISKIKDDQGNVLAEFKPEISEERSISENNRKIMIEMMKATVNEGTATRLRTTYGLRNDLLEKTYFWKDLDKKNLEEDGVIVGEDKSSEFVTAIGKHRFWKREEKDSIPA